MKALAALTALAFVLRAATLDVQSYWLDEAFTVLATRESFGGMLDAVADSESTPPLYYALAWLWSQVFGDGEVGLRSLSAVIGTLTVPAAYAAARELLTERAALVLAALIAVNPLLIWYSQEARAYALVVLLTTLSFLLFARALRQPGGPTAATWAACAVLALLSHYFAAFIVLPQLVWLLARSRARAAVAAAVSVAVAAVALLPLALHQRDHGGASGVSEQALGERFQAVPRKFLVGEYGGPVDGLAPLAAVLALAAVALLVARGARGEVRAALLPAAFAAAAVAGPLILAVAGFDYLTARYLLVAWVPALAVVAAGAAGARPRGAGMALAAALGGVFLVCSLAVPLTERLQRDDWRSAAHDLGPLRAPRAIVLSPAPSFVPLSIYEPEITEVAIGPTDPFAAEEVAVLFLTRASPRPQPPPPAPGLTLVRRVDAPTYSLLLFRARRAVIVSRDRLAGVRPTPDPSGAVFERP